jgi:ankyrin repeat protein
LQIACRRGHADIVATLLEQKADPDRRDGNGILRQLPWEPQ